jgi:putative flavoprotein involved in K+ transport
VELAYRWSDFPQKRTNHRRNGTSTVASGLLELPLRVGGRMNDVLDAVVIGAGWAGLGVSHGLGHSGISHVVLERGRIGETWRTQRWDSFRFNIPRVLTVMPGDRYDGSDPEGAMTCDEFVDMLESYVSRHGLPVHTGESVAEVTPAGAGGYLVRTPGRTLVARNVVVASGSLNRPRRPALALQIPPFVRQIDASDYRSPAALGTGAVLVVGSGQSGGQIAKDLSDAGRQVYCATSRIGRIPRRYRGRHPALWLVDMGALDVRREAFVLPSGAIPARALQGAVETLSLQSLSAQGVVLLGRVVSADGKVLTFSDDVAENIRFADENSAQVRGRIDDYIARNGIDAPPATDDPAEVVPPKIPSPPITSLDLETSGIGTIVWCTGFDGDFSWLRVPGAIGADQQPSHVDGIGAAGGVYFPGLDFASTRKSETILAIANESRTIVGHILGRLDRA